MGRINRAIALGLTGLACAGAFTEWTSAQAGGGCATSAAPLAQTGSRTSHAYFSALVARPDCMAAFSLRDNAQLARFTHGPKNLAQRVTFDPANDNDPRRQDAAKIVVPAGEVSLRSTVRLPIGTTDGTSTLITWDAWFGSEFRFADTGIENYKTFQFASPARRIWFEVRTRFKLADAGSAGRAAKARQVRRGRGGDVTKEAPSQPPSSAGKGSGRADIGLVDVRAYGKEGTALGPNVQSGGPLLPQTGTFTLRAETWTRYWVLIEQRANDWDLVSFWVGDEDHDPVRIIDGRQLSVKGSVDEFWLQYNTSSHPRERLAQRVGYARNVVMLRNVKDVSSLLQRPAK